MKTSTKTVISINNISKVYEGPPPVRALDGVSLEIKEGDFVSIVGQSGSGKSTLANLICRFYDVSSGSINVDGINIKNLKKDALRNLIGLVTQDSILFNDSIKNNLLIAKPEATNEEIIECLKIANAWEFVSKMPEQIDSNIGDSGNKLSGGQKQRLSIARAVLKNPPILVLDEATSALDSESEKLVQNALENLMKNKTSLVIAHRLSTIQKADKIIVLEKGKIGEIYNIGCDEDMEISILDLAKKIHNLSKIKVSLEDSIEYVEDRPFNDKRYYINNTKLKNLGWNININFEDGINNLL